MLECSEMNIHYGKLHVIRDASFEIQEKEVVSIIGANGAGKSTIIHALTGLRKVTSGKIKFLGTPITNLPPHEIVNLGIVQVPEGRLVLPQMTFLENIEMGAYRKDARVKRQETMEFVFQLFPVLATRKKQMAGSLSGGQQQMLAIGRGLMAIPKLLLLDEPSLGLAPLLVEEIFKTIEKLKEGGTNLLVVEQNVFISLSHSNRGYVLEEGRITLTGTGRELFNNEHIKRAYLGI
jgi:branched-chain amino acid transport system ATP-binding protein